MIRTKKHLEFKCFLAIFVFAIILGIFFGSYFYINRSTKDVLTTISQEDFQKKVNNKDTFFIYIGRPSCPDCKKFLPKLESELVGINKKVFYYNTQSSASKKRGIRDFLKKFNVQYIPTILLFENGKEKNIYNCTNDKEFLEFLETIEKETI